jgi:hypothetical protein
VRLTYGAVIPLPPEPAFAFVTDPLNWPSFFSSMRGARKDADWGSVGGRAQMRTVVLGRTVTSDLEMTAWDPPHEFGYVSRQASAPALTNHRVLEPVPGGTRLSGTTEVTLRPGLPGLADGVRSASKRQRSRRSQELRPLRAVRRHATRRLGAPQVRSRSKWQS